MDDIPLLPALKSLKSLRLSNFPTPAIHPLSSACFRFYQAKCSIFLSFTTVEKGIRSSVWSFRAEFSPKTGENGVHTPHATSQRHNRPHNPPLDTLPSVSDTVMSLPIRQTSNLIYISDRSTRLTALPQCVG